MISFNEVRVNWQVSCAGVIVDISEKVLQNLVSNAVKYTRAGIVVIKAELENHGAGSGARHTAYFGLTVANMPVMDGYRLADKVRNGFNAPQSGAFLSSC